MIKKGARIWVGLSFIALIQFMTSDCPCPARIHAAYSRMKRLQPLYTFKPKIRRGGQDAFDLISMHRPEIYRLL